MITPQHKVSKLAAKIGLDADLYFKREDLHPLGSHKGRSIPLMIKKYSAEGWNNFCVASSGNAALAAALTVLKMNKTKKIHVGLTIFAGKKINKIKLRALENAAKGHGEIKIEGAANPRQRAFLAEKNGLAKNLRQSTDDLALAGYRSLAAELAKIKKLAAVFIPTSSGTTAQALHEAFRKSGLNPEIHIVQTQACHPMAQCKSKAEDSIADAIVDTVAHRKKAIAIVLKQSGGKAWVPTDKEIKQAVAAVKDTENTETSPNGALSVAGLALAIKKGRRFAGPVVCLITGR